MHDMPMLAVNECMGRSPRQLHEQDAMNDMYRRTNHPTPKNLSIKVDTAFTGVSGEQMVNFASSSKFFGRRQSPVSRPQ